MTINNEFEIGQTVYLKTDPNQYQRMVVQIVIRAKDILYDIVCAESLYTAHSFELSSEKDQLMICQ
jgi:hypothetical protein